jgi:hypothetical protein
MRSTAILRRCRALPGSGASPTKRKPGLSLVGLDCRQPMTKTLAKLGVVRNRHPPTLNWNQWTEACAAPVSGESMWFGVNETMVGTHSGWMVPASIDLSLASAVTFNWSEPRYAALFRKDLPPRNNIINGRFPPAVGAYCTKNL